MGLKIPRSLRTVRVRVPPPVRNIKGTQMQEYKNPMILGAVGLILLGLNCPISGMLAIISSIAWGFHIKDGG